MRLLLCIVLLSCFLCNAKKEFTAVRSMKQLAAPSVKFTQALRSASVIVLGAGSNQLLWKPSKANAAISSKLTALGGEYLVNRVGTAENSAFKPGVCADDFYFPSWFSGDWVTSSVFDAIEAPLGVEVLGGKPVYDSAVKDIQSVLRYTTRFVPAIEKQQEGRFICDRYFNVKDIARASMGDNSVIDSPEVEGRYNDPAKEMVMFLQPQQSNGVTYKVQLVTTDRVQYEPSESQFAIMERTKQTIQQQSLVKDGAGSTASPSLEKEIETITVYTRLGSASDSNQIVAKQRTAVFLSKSDPRYQLAASREPAVANNAIDIRFYTLTMSRKK